MQIRTTLIIASIVIVLVIAIYKIIQFLSVDNDLKTKIKDGAILLDVRTVNEYKSGHIQGAINMPLGNIKQDYIKLNSQLTYITYCSHGLRSIKVYNFLKEKGFDNVYNGGSMSSLEQQLQ